MKHYLWVFWAVIGFLVIAFIWNHHTPMKNQERKVTMLKDQVKTLNSIDPEDTIFTDLQFLKKRLKGKDIVMLGEATHYDASTFRAKGRLIRFLHQELNYDVLVYEAGLYDAYLLWQKIKANPGQKTGIFGKSLYDFWYANEANQPLLRYILSKVNTPDELEVAGLDLQLTGSIGNDKRASLVKAYLSKKPGIDSNQYPAFFDIIPDYQKYAGWQQSKLTEEKKKSIQQEIKHIIKKLASKGPANAKDSLYLRFFKNLQSLYHYNWQYEYGSAQRFHFRDSVMAANFFWLKENFYQDQKVIIWASNLHLSYDNDQYTEPPDELHFTSMGERIKQKYSDRCYAINFTSFSNDRYPASSEKIYNNKTVEYLLHQLNNPYYYMDFNTIDTATFLHDPILMKCNQDKPFRAKWANITDGVFFINRMSSVKKKFQ